MSKPEQIVRVGHYRLGATLGQGSFGKVKIAEHEITGHKVAVKILNRKRIKSAQMDQKISREIKILKLVRHPHVIRLYEVIETPNDIFMIMEYVSGGELFDHIVKNGRLKEDAARRMFQQIICGVECIHHFRVVHRDLKPENLLLDADMNVKIADFGLSNLMTDGDFMKTSCGSPNYAAPEVITGKLYAGPEVDVWSCGVILYALTCGRLPFDEDSIPALFRKIRQGSYVLPSFVSKPCRKMISRMLAVDPLQRMTIAQVRENPWFRENLPKYLSLSPEEQQQSGEKIDQELLQFVADRMEIPLDVAMKLLLTGIKTSLSVAYYILLDVKQRRNNKKDEAEDADSIEIRQNSLNRTLDASMPDNLKPAPIMDMLYASQQGNKKMEQLNYNQSVTNTFLDPWAESSYLSSPLELMSEPELDFNPLTEKVTRNGSPLVDSFGSTKSGPEPLTEFRSKPISIAGAGKMIRNATSEGSMDSNPKVVPDVQNNWRLGMYTALDSGNAMKIVYEVLKELGFAWRVLAPFHLLCRIRDAKGFNAQVGIGVQLYRMHDQHDRGYLVDLMVATGHLPNCIDAVCVLYDCLTKRFDAQQHLV